MNEFQIGFLTAVSLMNTLADQPTLCADVIREADFEGANCFLLDEFDKEQMRIIVDQTGIILEGLY